MRILGLTFFKEKLKMTDMKLMHEGNKNIILKSKNMYNDV